MLILIEYMKYTKGKLTNLDKLEDLLLLLVKESGEVKDIRLLPAFEYSMEKKFYLCSSDFDACILFDKEYFNVK
jgi:hypothetical protein